MREGEEEGRMASGGNGRRREGRKERKQKRPQIHGWKNTKIGKHLLFFMNENESLMGNDTN